MEFIELKKQYSLLKDKIDSAISEVLTSGTFIMGPAVDELENKLAAFVGTRYAIGVSSGTDALLVSLMAQGISSGDYIFTTPFTFAATAEVIVLLGATPVFVDIDPETLNISPEQLEHTIRKFKKAGKPVKGIITVSLYGQPADHDEISEIADRYGAWVIEDACQSFGATYKGRKSCNLSDIGVTSFFPSKPLGCYGDGGMIFTQDARLAERCKAIRAHGQTGRYIHEVIGLNARLDTLQAAVLLAKLPGFPDEIRRREIIGKRYTRLLNDYLPVVKVKSDRSSVYAQYTVRIQEKNDPGRRVKVANYLNKKGIPTAIHYPIPLHLQRSFAFTGYKKEDFIVAEQAAREVLSLPMHPWLTAEQQDFIAESVIEAVKIYF